MTEIIAVIGANGRVELTDDRSVKIASLDSMSPADAAYLARGMLSCAVSLYGTNPPRTGTIVGDTHMPVMKWAVGSSEFTGEPALILSVPSGIELTFVMSAQGAKAIGAALVSQGDGKAPPDGQRGAIH